MQFVDIEHPDFGRARVPETAVRHLGDGWAVLGVAQSPTEPAAPYDPSEHTVTEVLAYLEKVDPEEQDRVLDEERAGKNRTGIVGA